ncbi:MAG: phosphodiester glycosidase family protein [Oscillospiraceae bacterium]|nr:phosphodiester glycosidase family protein [Oscillospiraceae bacterium]
MNNDDFGLDLSIDDILSEFTESSAARTGSLADESLPQPPEREEPVPESEYDFSAEETAVYTTVPPETTEDKITHFADKYRKPAPGNEAKESTSYQHEDDSASRRSGGEKASHSRGKTEEQRLEEKNEKQARKEALKAEKEAKRAEKQARKAEKAAARLEKPPRDTFADVMPRWLVRFVGLILTSVLLLFVLCRVVPASGSAASTKAPLKSVDISATVNRYASEKAREAALAASAHAEELALQQALEEAAAVKTVYKIAEDATVAPAPLVSGFGQVSTANAAEIMNIIQQARDLGLLDADERVVFDPNVEFNTGSYYQDIQYYLDDTLLVICWKEIIDGNTCTFCEVKMQDGSQIRRKLAGDMFGSDILEYTTSMHKATNAVVSMNADYYRFRDMGIVAYNRQLYRFNESLYLNRYGQDLKKYNCVDTLFVTASGDFLFFHQYEETTPEAMQQFILDNDIIFSVAFGPVLVENGVLNASRDFEEEWYPIGEVNTGYSRAGIGQVGKLHYLYMSLNHSDEKQARWRVKEFGQHFYEKGVLNAYNLDGGQTGEIVFQGNEAYNHVDHVNGTSSRQVSDMIYFASAINGEEVTQ